MWSSRVRRGKSQSCTLCGHMSRMHVSNTNLVNTNLSCSEDLPYAWSWLESAVWNADNPVGTYQKEPNCRGLNCQVASACGLITGSMMSVDTCLVGSLWCTWVQLIIKTEGMGCMKSHFEWQWPWHSPPQSRMKVILKVSGAVFAVVEENHLAPCAEHEVWKPG